MTPNTERLNVVIPIGGSGMRVAEAFVHLAASGFFKDKDIDNMYIFPVDPDVNNGNLLRLMNVVATYKSIRSNLANNIPKGLENLPIFSTRLEISPRALIPMRDARSFTSIFNLNEDRQSDILARSLYTSEELEQELGEGFRGRPSIGLPVILYHVPQQDLWQRLVELIRQKQNLNSELRVILIGSVFGGTGASGLPAISKLLRNQFKNIKIAGIFLLPYFRFRVDPFAEGIVANPDTFDQKTLQALRYYGLSGYDRVFDHIYMIGFRRPFIFRRFALGARGQLNPITIIDLIAATAIKDFLDRDFNREPNAKISFINASTRGNSIVFSDIAVRRRLSGISVRPITYINLFIIFSLMFFAYFRGSEGIHRAIGYKIFDFKELSGKTLEEIEESNFVNLMIRYIREYIQFIREVSVMDDEKYDSLSGGFANVNLTSDIILNSLVGMINNFSRLLGSIDNPQGIRSSKFQDAYDVFLRDHRKNLLHLNKNVVNVLAALSYRNEAEFALYLYSAIAYYSYVLVEKLRGENDDWGVIFGEVTMKIILQMIGHILRTMGLTVIEDAIGG